MKDLIYRPDALTAYSDAMSINKVSSALSIVHKGHWKLDFKKNQMTCSECGRTFKGGFDLDNADNFCRHCGADMRDDTISRQMAINEITEYGGSNVVYMSVEELRKRLENLPSLSLEIITCKDCVKKDRCRFYEFQGDTGYCRYGKDKDGRLNPQTRRN